MPDACDRVVRRLRVEVLQARDWLVRLRHRIRVNEQRIPVQREVVYDLRDRVQREIRSDYEYEVRELSYIICLSQKNTIWKLLNVEEYIGVKLTESLAMWPAASVSGYYFANEEADLQVVPACYAV